MTSTQHRHQMSVPPPPRPSLRTVIGGALIRKVIAGTPVRIQFPDGSTIGAGPPNSPTIIAHRPEAVFARMADNPKVGMGEGYVAGEWEPAVGSDLAGVMVPFAERITEMLPAPLLAMRRIADRALPGVQRNTLSGARANIAAHYDLSNDHFAAFLDETMTYSSALFDEDRPFADQDLATAQRNKIDAILDAAHVGEGTRLLEIGTGWGELALRAASRGALVTSITLSKEQQGLAQERINKAGLGPLVDIRLEDYREVEGLYDAIVSVEMIEAVGEEFWPTYFQSIDRLLAPGGVAAIQSIVMSHARLRATRNSFGFIQKYIFPGGLIPSVQAIGEITAQHTSLRVSGAVTFGAHYAETLHRWRQRFLANWPHVEALGFDPHFRRMWEFYLAYCEAGFVSGYIDVAHVTLRRP